MATVDIGRSHVREGKLGALRCALTGAVVLIVLFALCWAAAVSGFLANAHMYISLFTVAPVASVAALVIGLFWSAVFGALSGALVAVAYNALAFVERR